jgi:hypothetical protein
MKYINVWLFIKMWWWWIITAVVTITAIIIGVNDDTSGWRDGVGIY